MKIHICEKCKKKLYDEYYVFIGVGHWHLFGIFPIWKIIPYYYCLKHSGIYNRKRGKK